MGELGDAHAPGDLAIALPVRRRASQEWVVGRRLDLTIRGDRARGDRVLAGGGRSPVDGPERPGERATLAIIGKEGRGLPRLLVDPHLDAREWRSPGRPHDLVVVALPRHLRRGGLEPVMRDGGEGPDGLAVTLFFTDGDVVAGHEVALVAAVTDLDAAQPLHVGDPVPAGRDQP